VFHRQIEWVADLASQLTQSAVGAAVLFGGVFVALKYLARRRLLHELRVARITPDELHTLLEGPEQPLIVDMRSAGEWAHGGLPGALRLSLDALESVVPARAGRHEVVLYCS
jgi:hypothetical protein